MLCNVFRCGHRWEPIDYGSPIAASWPDLGVDKRVAVNNLHALLRVDDGRHGSGYFPGRRRGQARVLLR